MKKIFDYTNYRQYLKDYYNYKKENTEFFSFRYFSKKAGFRSPSILKFIINGERNLKPESIEKFIDVIDLNKKEAAYFRALVNFNQAKTEKLKNRYYNEFIKLFPSSNLKQMEKDQYEIYNKWYHIPIRELISISDFKEDPKWIANRLIPSIKPSEAEKSLKLLKSLGFIKYNKNKKLVVSDPFITTGDEVKSLLIRNFHRHMINLAHESIEKFPKEEREISSITVGISKQTFEEIKTRISAFEDELLEIISKSSNESEYVYQLNFQFFPISKPKENKK